MTGEELRKRREKAGITQERLAELIGLTHPYRRQTIYKYEAGVNQIPETTALLLNIKLSELGRRRHGDKKPVA